MSSTRVALLALALACATAAPSLAAPNVVVSIKPIHALVADVMDGVGTPTLLLPSASSPHVYTLRPSDARALEAAAVVVWVGPELETFLEKPVAAIARRAQVVTLARDAGLALLPAREAGADGHAAGLDVMDMHLWLDPENARRIVVYVAKILSLADPANAVRYAANRDRTFARLEVLDREVAALLAPAAGKPLFALHDGFQYLETRYGLNEAGTVTVSSDRVPGAKLLLAAREAIRTAGIVCVLGEPQFSAALAQTVVEGTGAVVVIVDPMGAAAPQGPGAYDAILRTMAKAVRECLVPAV